MLMLLINIFKNIKIMDAPTANGALHVFIHILKDIKIVSFHL